MLVMLPKRAEMTIRENRERRKEKNLLQDDLVFCLLTQCQLEASVVLCRGAEQEKDELLYTKMYLSIFVLNKYHSLLHPGVWIIKCSYMESPL